MSQLPDPSWSDNELVQCIAHWSLACGKCGLDSEKYNWISSTYLRPCSNILKGRGADALAKLLPLLHDDDPDIRLTAASIAYAVNVTKCRQALLDLMKTPDRIGIAAWGSLTALDPKNAPMPTELWGKE